MKTFKPKAQNMKLAGILQSFGKPISEIFLDESTNKIYVTVLISSPQERPLVYAITETSSKLIREYMEGIMTLHAIFDNSPIWKAEVSDSNINITDNIKTLPEFRLKPFDHYDESLCDSDVLLECFLDEYDETFNLDKNDNKNNKLQSGPILLQCGVMEEEQRYGKNKS